MQCPKCGAEVTGKFCEYCGSELPQNAPENVNVSNAQTIINNYYQTPVGNQAPVTNQAPVINQTPVTNQTPPPQPTYAAPQQQAPVYAYQQTESPKSRMIALLLSIFLGYFGGHQFYVGKIGMGFLYLFTAGLFCIGWIVDIVNIAMGKFKDAQGLPLK